MIYTVSVQNALSMPKEPALRVQLIGHQWWWEVRYPDEGVVTANEVHIPAGTPVLFELTSADVIHSFWAPAAAGQDGPAARARPTRPG